MSCWSFAMLRTFDNESSLNCGLEQFHWSATWEKHWLYILTMSSTPVWLNSYVFVHELSGCGFDSRCGHLNFRYRACFEQEVTRHSGIQTFRHSLDIEYRFTLKRVRDRIRTYSQMHRTNRYSQHSLIIRPVWLNGWVFIYGLSGFEFESRGSHEKKRFVFSDFVN